jgi:hypothetical protein
MELEQLLQKLHQAFLLVPFPRERITSHYCDECDGIATFLRGRDREFLSRDDLNVFGDGRMNLITSNAIQYYFPQIIEKALSPGESDLLKDVLYYLDFYSSRSGSNVALCSGSEIALFTEDQQQAMLDFLSFVKDNHYSDIIEYMLEDELDKAIQTWA